MSELSADSRALIAEAAEWRLLALLFEYPGEEWRRQLDALASEVPQQELRRAAEGSQQEACEGLHIALFGPGGPVSLREATYQGGVQLGYLMSELSAIYDAFGFQPRTEEALDHLSVDELEMLVLIEQPGGDHTVVLVAGETPQRDRRSGARARHGISVRERINRHRPASGCAKLRFMRVGSKPLPCI